jgi:hypothetical protein
MTLAQVRRAARLYLLANTACLDLGGCSTEEEGFVVAQAIRDARAALARYDLEPCQVGSVQACIDLAKKGT